jgi:MHS family proline/betaine transporter-like MFS transporter
MEASDRAGILYHYAAQLDLLSVLTFASTYMWRILKFDSGTTLFHVFIASLAAAFVMPLGGAFTDRYAGNRF